MLKRVLPALLGFSLCLSVCAGCASASTTSAEADDEAVAEATASLPNTFSERGMTFDYPRGWTKTASDNGYTFTLTSPIDIPFSTVNAGASYDDAPFPNPFAADSIDQWTVDFTDVLESAGIAITSEPIVEDDGHVVSYVASGSMDSGDASFGAFVYFGFTADAVYSIVTAIDGDTTTDTANEIAEMYTTIRID